MSIPDRKIEASDNLYHGAAWGMLVVCPLVALLPPRRLNFGTTSLGVSWLLSANYLVQERRHRPSIIGVCRTDEDSLAQDKDTGKGEREATTIHKFKDPADQKKSLSQLPTSQVEDTRRRRIEYHQDKLDEGAGYGDIIKEQIWDVWNQNKDNKE